MAIQSKEIQIPINGGMTELSSFQQRIWYLEQLASTQSRMNIVALYELVGKLNIKQLQQNLDTLVGSFDILRSVIAEEDSTAVLKDERNLQNYGIIDSEEEVNRDNPSWLKMIRISGFVMPEYWISRGLMISSEVENPVRTVTGYSLRWLAYKPERMAAWQSI